VIKKNRPGLLVGGDERHGRWGNLGSDDRSICYSYSSTVRLLSGSRAAFAITSRVLSLAKRCPDIYRPSSKASNVFLSELSSLSTKHGRSVLAAGLERKK